MFFDGSDNQVPFNITRENLNANHQEMGRLQRENDL